MPSLPQFLPSFSNKTCPAWLLTLIVSAYLLLAFNSSLFSTVYVLHGDGGMKGLIYLASLFVLLLSAFTLLLNTVTVPIATKPLLIFLVISSSFAAYFMQSYNILIDTTMIQNSVETDIHESLELFNIKLVLYVLALGVLPSWLIIKCRIVYGTPLQFVLTKLVSSVVCIVLMSVVALLFYQDYASLFRNNRYIRDLIVPVNYLHAGHKYAVQQLPHKQPNFKHIGEDAQRNSLSSNSAKKPVVTVVIVGETARSANFSLFGYNRLTTPLLAQQNILAFNNVSACGTSTAVSLPCMFSRQNRTQYKRIESINSDNVLDIAQRAGLHVIWLDNNSGCKGVCTRIESQTLPPSTDTSLCNNGECYDMLLVKQLAHVIENNSDDMLLVLHQKGSHGPAYFLRTPEAFHQFKPLCHTNQLQECTREEITNAYDNTILYTDYVVNTIIELLKSQAYRLDTSMVYISDHGESLGENNLYLHGLPYVIAPSEQTHVPLIMWLSQGYSQRFGIDTDCLSQHQSNAYSHDNVFDSLLGLLNIITHAYKPSQDILNGCKQSNTQPLHHLQTASNNR